MQGFADRVDYRRQFDFHIHEYASLEVIIQLNWMNEQLSPTNEH
jgi:hypothetical protein